MAQTAAAAGTAGPATLSQRRVLVIIGALLLGMLLAALDQTIVATALPTIAGDLHGLSHLSWVVTAYLLASTASTPLWGKLGDLYGRKIFFQAAIVIFLAGSALAGLSGSMAQLIAFRAVQGIGGGGLMAGAQAIVGDVVAPRDRGRYQGIFGAVFGVTSVLGPLIGGFFVDHLTWRWVFYVNLPIGAVALAVVAAVLPGRLRRTSHRIDYLGTALLATAATSLVLLTSLGGVSFAWLSAPVFIMGAVAVIAAAGFAVAERRAAEPVLPLRLFGNRVFLTTSAVGLVIGFAMFGSLTYLPQYMQIVRGVSPTSSGLRLLPMMAGLLLTSIVTGRLVSRFGRYKVFPVAGTAVMTAGLYLLSLLTSTTPAALASLYMFVLGAGIGASMQVLVIAVQNAVSYSDLGTATAGATFFRSIGGSFGTAVFGAIFAGVLPRNLSRALGGRALPHGLTATAGASPAVLDRLPAPVHAAFVTSYAASLHTVFLASVPAGALAFALSWTLKEVPLRSTTRAPDPADTLAPTARPSVRDASQEMERAVTSLLSRERRRVVYTELVAAAGLDLTPRAGWLLLRAGEHPGMSRRDLARLLRLTGADMDRRLADLAAPGYLAAPEYLAQDGGPDGNDGRAESHGRAGGAHGRAGSGGADGGQRRAEAGNECPVVLTAAGQEAFERLWRAREERIRRLCADWQPERYPELTALITAITHQLAAGGEKPGADLDAA
jgi:EmrB/QacA subfamily drug resistance transporter